MKIFYILSVAFLSCSLSSSQQLPTGLSEPINQNRTSSLTPEMMLFRELETLSMHQVLVNYTGSPYLNEEFERGVVEFSDKNVAGFLRYNVLESSMEIMVNKGKEEFYLLPRRADIEYLINGQKVSWKKVNTENGWKDAYVLKYFEDKNVRFYGIPSIQITEESTPQSGYDKIVPAHYKVVMEYYLATDRGKMEQIKTLKGKYIEKILGKSNAVENYLEDRKVRTVEDVVELLDAYTAM